MATVRYLVTDVERSIAFYTKALGFKLDQSMAPAFARVSNNDLTLWLAGPQSSAARPMPDARRPGLADGIASSSRWRILCHAWPI